MTMVATTEHAIPAQPKARVCRAPNLAGRYSSNRIAEWVAAIAMTLFGLQTIIWPESIVASNFAPILNITTWWAIAYISLLWGVARITALIANGRWPMAGPIIRAMGAVVGAALIASIAFALALHVIDKLRPPSPGIPWYLGLLIGELISAKRAAADVRFPRKL